MASCSAARPIRRRTSLRMSTGSCSGQGPAADTRRDHRRSAALRRGAHRAWRAPEQHRAPHPRSLSRRAGARAFRRHLSENAPRAGAGVDVLREAVALVEHADGRARRGGGVSVRQRCSTGLALRGDVRLRVRVGDVAAVCVGGRADRGIAQRTRLDCRHSSPLRRSATSAARPSTGGWAARCTASRAALVSIQAGRHRDRATEQFAAHGAWMLLLSWLPVIGDPLTLVAGVLRVPLAMFLALVTIGKAARYIVIAWLTVDAAQRRSVRPARRRREVALKAAAAARAAAHDLLDGVRCSWPSCRRIRGR